MSRVALVLLACLSSVPAFALDERLDYEGGRGADCGTAKALVKGGGHSSRAERSSLVPAPPRGPSEREIRERRMADADRVKQNAKAGKILSGICSGC
jgi:hypothetical protein